jgi:hypothetical protein
MGEGGGRGDRGPAARRRRGEGWQGGGGGGVVGGDCAAQCDRQQGQEMDLRSGGEAAVSEERRG